MITWVTEITEWITNPVNADQNGVSKNKFVKTAKVGPVTKLSAVGISNGKLKKYATEFYKKNKTIDFSELFGGLDYVYMHAQYVEEHMFVVYTLEKFKELLNNHHEVIFDRINSAWIDNIDHWTSADHLCINVMPYIPVRNYLKIIDSWTYSLNFWRQRLSIVVFLKHIKSDPKVHQIIIEHINRLKTTKNYYVRKAFPWLLREVSKQNTTLIMDYLLSNYMYFNKTELREASKNLPQDVISILIKKYMDSK